MTQTNRTPALTGDRGSEMRLAERLDGSENTKKGLNFQDVAAIFRNWGKSPGAPWRKTHI
jgi:hypothetical protein